MTGINNNNDRFLNLNSKRAIQPAPIKKAVEKALDEGNGSPVIKNNEPMIDNNPPKSWLDIDKNLLITTNNIKFTIIAKTPAEADNAQYVDDSGNLGGNNRTEITIDADYIRNHEESHGVNISQNDINRILDMFNNLSEQQKNQVYLLLEKESSSDLELSFETILKIAELPSDKFNIIDEILYIPEREDEQLSEDFILNLLNLPENKLNIAKQLAYIKEKGDYQFNEADINMLLSLTNEQLDIAKNYFVLSNRDEDEQLGADVITAIAKMSPEDRKKVDNALAQETNVTFRVTHNNNFEIVYKDDDGNIKIVQIPSGIEEHYSSNGNKIYDELIKYDENGNIIEITRIQPSGIDGYDNITIERDGKIYEVQKAYRDEKTGEIVVIQNMVSPNGTTTSTVYKEKEDGSYTMQYTITDADGNVLLERYQSLTKVSDTKTITTINGKTYTAEYFNDHVTITDSDNYTYTLDFNSLFRDPDTGECDLNDDFVKQMIEMLKNIPADKLITLINDYSAIGPAMNAYVSPNGMINMPIQGDDTRISTFMHEMGHSIELDHDSEKFTDISTDEELLAIFQRELEACQNNMSGNWEEILKHIIYDGYTELVGESNMILNGYHYSDEERLRSLLFQQFFPETIARISQLLDERIQEKLDSVKETQNNNNNTEPENTVNGNPLGHDSKPWQRDTRPMHNNDGLNNMQDSNVEIRNNSIVDKYDIQDPFVRPFVPNSGFGGNNKGNVDNNNNNIISENNPTHNQDINEPENNKGVDNPNETVVTPDENTGVTNGTGNTENGGEETGSTETETVTLTAQQLAKLGLLTFIAQMLYGENAGSANMTDEDIVRELQNYYNQNTEGWSYTVTANGDGTYTITRTRTTGTVPGADNSDDWLNTINDILTGLGDYVSEERRWLAVLGADDTGLLASLEDSGLLKLVTGDINNFCGIEVDGCALELYELAMALLYSGNCGSFAEACDMVKNMVFYAYANGEYEAPDDLSKDEINSYIQLITSTLEKIKSGELDSSDVYFNGLLLPQGGAGELEIYAQQLLKTGIYRTIDEARNAISEFLGLHNGISIALSAEDFMTMLTEMTGNDLLGIEGLRERTKILINAANYALSIGDTLQYQSYMEVIDQNMGIINRYYVIQELASQIFNMFGFAVEWSGGDEINVEEWGVSNTAQKIFDYLYEKMDQDYEAGYNYMQVMFRMQDRAQDLYNMKDNLLNCTSISEVEHSLDMFAANESNRKDYSWLAVTDPFEGVDLGYGNSNNQTRYTQTQHVSYVESLRWKILCLEEDRCNNMSRNFDSFTNEWLVAEYYSNDRYFAAIAEIEAELQRVQQEIDKAKMNYYTALLMYGPEAPQTVNAKKHYEELMTLYYGEDSTLARDTTTFYYA